MLRPPSRVVSQTQVLKPVSPSPAAALASSAGQLQMVPPGLLQTVLAEASASGHAGAGANGHSGAASGSPEAARSLNGLVTAVEDDQEIQNIRALMRRPPFRHKTQLEYYALPAGVKVIIHPCIASFARLFKCLFNCLFI